MNEEIKSILENLEIPVAHLRYKGNSSRFVTWTITGEAPVLSANDEILCSICSVDVDIFSDGNYLDIEREVKQKMKDNDWIWVEDSEEMYEDDTGLYHKTISFEKERTIEWQE